MATTTRTNVYVSSVNLIKEEVDISDDEVVLDEIDEEEVVEGDEGEPYFGGRMFELPDFDADEPDVPDYDPLGTDYDISVEAGNEVNVQNESTLFCTDLLWSLSYYFIVYFRGRCY